MVHSEIPLNHHFCCRNHHRIPTDDEIPIENHMFSSFLFVRSHGSNGFFLLELSGKPPHHEVAQAVAAQQPSQTKETLHDDHGVRVEETFLRNPGISWDFFRWETMAINFMVLKRLVAITEHDLIMAWEGDWCFCSRRWMWQRWCGWCETKLYVKKGVWQRWCVTKLCVTKMVCDKVVCEIWCVTKLCVKKGVL